MRRSGAGSVWGARVLLLVAGASASAACSALLGYDESSSFPNVGGSAAAAGNTAGGAGGALGGHGGAGATGGTAGSAGAGGALPECTHLGQQDTCGADRKCTIVDPNTGTLGCVASGSTPDFGACTSNEECATSSWCDDATGVCRPICQDAETCAQLLGGGSVCAPTTQGGHPVVGNLQVCTAHCNPTTNVPCLGGPNVAVSCAWRSARNDWDCVLSGGKADGEACTDGWECSPGLLCAPDHTCQPPCTAPLGCCGSCVLCVCDSSCEPFSPQLFHDGQEIGACYGPAEHFPPNACC